MKQNWRPQTRYSSYCWPQNKIQLFCLNCFHNIIRKIQENCLLVTIISSTMATNANGVNRLNGFWWRCCPFLSPTSTMIPYLLTLLLRSLFYVTNYCKLQSVTHQSSHIGARSWSSTTNFPWRYGPLSRLSARFNKGVTEKSTQSQFWLSQSLLIACGSLIGNFEPALKSRTFEIAILKISTVLYHVKFWWPK